MTHDTGWFTSSRSASGSSACVEVRLTDAAVGVRDSKNPAGPAFEFSPSAWSSFLERVTRD